MTAQDRLRGLAYFVPMLLATIAYGAVISRRGRRRPWALAIGMALLIVTVMIPWFPLVFVAGIFGAIDIHDSHMHPIRTRPENANLHLRGGPPRHRRPRRARSAGRNGEGPP